MSFLYLVEFRREIRGANLCQKGAEVILGSEKRIAGRRKMADGNGKMAYCRTWERWRTGMGKCVLQDGEDGGGD